MNGKDHLSVREKKFRGAHVYSIVKKKRGFRNEKYSQATDITIRNVRLKPKGRIVHHIYFFKICDLTYI